MDLEGFAMMTGEAEGQVQKARLALADSQVKCKDLQKVAQEHEAAIAEQVKASKAFEVSTQETLLQCKSLHAHGIAVGSVA